MKQANKPRGQIDLQPGERIDYLERGDYHIIQKEDGFCFGIDAVLLSGFVRVYAGERLIDLGTGTGILPLLLHAKTACRDLTGVELQPAYAEMAARSVAMNGIEKDIRIVQAEVTQLEERQAYDVVVSNPPYMRIGSGRINDSDSVALARHETACDLRGWLRTAAVLLKENGRIYLVHRPNRLAELLQLMHEQRLEPKQLRMVQSYSDQKPVLILVEGVKGAKPDLQVREPLVIYQAPNVYTEEVLRIYGKEVTTEEAEPTVVEVEPTAAEMEPIAGETVSQTVEIEAAETAQRQINSPTGGLWLVGTPIGNLSDMSPRAIETLQTVDMIAAEDTRHSLHLLQHFGIRAKLTSYHEFNKIDKAHELIRQMQEGKRIALITDAGMPGISDPGEELVHFCHRAGVPVSVIPGPSAVVSALVMSGLPTRYFHFEGFLPKDKKEKRERLAVLGQLTDTLVLYEAPHRLLKTLTELEQALGDRRAVTVRELTKVYEQRREGRLSELAKLYQEQSPKGEFVILIEGRSVEDIRAEERLRWEQLSVTEHVAYYREQGMSEKDAMKAAAKDRGTTKREIYSHLHR